MTDVAYLCHNCGSVHEVESIPENLIFDLRTAASHELPDQQGILDPRARFLRWRMTRGLAQALWPEYAHHPRLAGGRRLVPGRPHLIALCPAGQQLVAAMRILSRCTWLTDPATAALLPSACQPIIAQSAR